jgi:hypothetical protein
VADERPRPDVDLVRSELTGLVDRLVDGDPAEPLGLYVVEGADPAAELGRWVERAVFQQAFGDTPALLREEYGPYEDASLFFCVIDHRRRVPAGVIRAITPSPAGLKSLVDLERFSGRPAAEVLRDSGAYFDPQRTWDLATVAVAPEYQGPGRSGPVSQALFLGLGTTSTFHDIRHAVTVLDVIVLRYVQWQFHKPFRNYLGVPPKPYLGSPMSCPMWSDIGEWRARMVRDVPHLEDLLFRARGLEGVVRLPERLAEVAVSSSAAPPSTGRP